MSQISLGKDLVVLELVGERQEQHEAGWRQERTEARQEVRKSTIFLFRWLQAIAQGSVVLVALGTEAPSTPGRDRLMPNNVLCIAWRNFDPAGS